MSHVHGPNCGCQDFAYADESQDLFDCIDLQNIKCLNEQKTNSGKQIFYPIAQKYEKNFEVQSDIEGELLFIIPFNTRVKIMTLQIMCSNGFEPEDANLWSNQQNVDFSIVEEIEPLQTLKVVQDGEYAIKQSKFTNVSKLILHLKSEIKDEIKINHIGIKGQNLKHKDQIVKATYEANAIPKDHNVKTENQNTFHNF